MPRFASHCNQLDIDKLGASAAPSSAELLMISSFAHNNSCPTFAYTRYVILDDNTVVPIVLNQFLAYCPMLYYG